MNREEAVLYFSKKLIEIEKSIRNRDSEIAILTEKIKEGLYCEEESRHPSGSGENYSFEYWVKSREDRARRAIATHTSAILSLMAERSAIKFLMGGQCSDPPTAESVTRDAFDRLFLLGPARMKHLSEPQLFKLLERLPLQCKYAMQELCDRATCRAAI